MLTVQDDWIQYEETPVRRVAVRGGGACAQRIPVMRVVAPPRPVLIAVPAPPARAAVRRTDRRGPGTGSAPLRLTRRGRLVLIVLPGLLALSGTVVGLAAAAAPVGGAPASLQARLVSDRTVVVGRGESLWTVARRIAPQQDPRVVVDALRRVNGLHGSTVAAGASLHLPSGR